MDLDERTLRWLAVSVRPLLSLLLGDSDRAVAVDRELTAGLDMPLGSALPTLRRTLFLGDAEVREWCRQFIRTRESWYRTVTESTSETADDGGGSGSGGSISYGDEAGSGSDEGGAWTPTPDDGGPGPVEFPGPPERPSPEPEDPSEPAWNEVDGRALTFAMPGLREPGQSAVVGQTYEGCFSVAQSEGNLLIGNTLITPAEVGEDGLMTSWTVASRTIRLDPWTRDGHSDPDMEFENLEAGDDTDYLAAFPLHIPASGASVVRKLALTPLRDPTGVLQVDILVGDDLYRRLTATIEVRPAETPPVPGESEVPRPMPEQPGPRRSPFVFGEQRMVSAAHAGLVLPPAYAPRRTLRLVVTRGELTIWDSDDGVTRPRPWKPNLGDLNTAIGEARAALDRLRDKFPDAFDAPDPNDLEGELRTYKDDVDGDWFGPAAGGPAGEVVESVPGLATSSELRDLAAQGQLLFTSLFTDEMLQARIASLQPGDLVDFMWVQDTDAAAPAVPLPLLFLGDVPDRDEPVDAARFLGLAQRLAYRIRNPLDTTRSLGDWRATMRGHFLYWGSAMGDKVGEHAVRHATDLRVWEPITLLPKDPIHASTKELATFLKREEQGQMSLLYFYCHCNTRDGGSPILRFGATDGPDDVLKIADLMAGGRPLNGAPVAFVNACKSSYAEAMLSNQLMTAFFTRGCRAYVGTEVRVPAGLAANFAVVFFSFLYGTAGLTLAPVGEAISQTRRFLWRRHGNLGGLFYSAFNDYKLYELSDADVRKLCIR
jgi:hypothetical protein